MGLYKIKGEQVTSLSNNLTMQHSTCIVGKLWRRTASIVGQRTAQRDKIPDLIMNGLAKQGFGAELFGRRRRA